MTDILWQFGQALSLAPCTRETSTFEWDTETILKDASVLKMRKDLPVERILKIYLQKENLNTCLQKGYIDTSLCAVKIYKYMSLEKKT